MESAQARFLLDFLLPQLISEQSVHRRILSAIPTGKGDYRPDPRSMSAMELAWHLVVCEIWFLDAVIHRQFGDLEPRPAEANTGPGIAQWYAGAFAQRLPQLQALTGDELATPVDYLGLRNDPAVAYLNIAIRHAVHHRGQLAAYLRPMGAKVPAIYVESGDEPYPPDSESGASNLEPPPAF